MCFGIIQLGGDAIYPCWLMFHLCALPLLKRRKELIAWLAGSELLEVGDAESLPVPTKL